MALNALQTFLFSYSVISMLVYSFMIFSIISQRKAVPILRGSFFKLVTGHFIADMLLFLEFNVLMRGRKYGYLNGIFVEGSTAFYIVPRLSNTLHYYAKIVVYIGQVYFALNRLTSALFPVDYNNIWSSMRLRLMIIAQWTVPLIAVLPVHLNMNFQIIYQEDQAHDTLRLITDKTSTEIIAFIDMGCSLICTVLSLCMYIGTIYIVRRGIQGRLTTCCLPFSCLTSRPCFLFESLSQQGTTRLAAIELRLLVSAFIVFGVLTLNTIVQVLTVITNEIGLEEVMFINDLSYPMIDLIYTCQPWALLISSSVMRKNLMATARRQSHRPIVITIPTDADACRESAVS